MTAGEMEQTVEWVLGLAQPIGGWTLAADMTFGSGEWLGRRRGTRRDRRDLLVSTRKRGFDPDDALLCFRKFMDRTLPHVTWFAAVEPNPDWSKINPGFHLHTTWAGLDEQVRLRAKKLWVEENGFCKIEPIRSLQAATQYCAKHLVKRGSLYGWKINDGSLFRALVQAS
jgi:hypothetical protein